MTSPARKSATSLDVGDVIAIQPAILAGDEAWIVTRPSELRKRSQMWTTVRRVGRSRARGYSGDYAVTVVYTDDGAMTMLPQTMCAIHD